MSTPATPLAPAPTAPFSDLCALAVRAAADEPGAVERLARELYELVPGTLRGVLSRRGFVLDAQAREDVVQEVVWKLVDRDLPRFDATRGTFATLIRYRVRWCLADALRGASRRSENELFTWEEEELCDAPAPVEERPDERLERAQVELRLLVLRDDVERVLADEPAARRAVVRHDLDGVKLADVAGELQVHTSNACRQRQKGLRLLAERLPAELREAA